MNTALFTSKRVLFQAAVGWCMLRGTPLRCRRLGRVTSPSPVISLRSRCASSAPSASVPPSLLRTIGLVAHVDAGKTTTCERMLYHAGVIREMGNVDEGTTVMDFMEMERARGITIKASGIRLNWQKHTFQILDTPGHVDFTVEVERSVRVLDAAVVLFDAVAGVQAQSETVWRQAARYGVPRLVFANKMDREGASVERLMSQLRTRLGATPLLLQVPIGSGSDFRGVVDLVSMRRLLWQDPHSGRLQADDLRPDTDPRLHHQASQAREQLVHATPEKQSSCSDAGQVETLAGLDDAVLEAALAGNVSAEILRAGLARALRQDRAVLCLLGSALRNRGIQPLLDAVVSYAPSPLDRPAPRARQLRTKGKELREPREVRVEASETGPLVALAFKVQHDPARGLVAYLRVYRGRLQSGTSVLNVSRNKRERIQYQEVAQAGVGTIVAAVGLQSVATGDTLVDASGQEVVQLEGVALPVPVFTCAVEPETLASAKDLEEALRTLQLEDPSFHVEQDQESGQTLLSGMGELHMEILAHRLREHYRVAARLGPMRISYRCTVAQARRLRHEHEDRKGRASLEVEVEPAPRGTGNSLTWSEEALAALPAGAYGAELRAAVEEGVGFGWARGAQLSVPLQDVAVRIHYAGVGAQDQASLASARAAASQAVVLACRDASPTLLEPVMRLEIEVSEEHLSGVLADLAHRQAMVLGVENLASGRRELRAEAPLRQLRGYSTTIRSLTQGTATLSMEFVRNQEVAQVALADVMKELRGF